MPLPFIVTALLPTIIEKVFGKKKAQVIEGVVNTVRETKGLIKSKTAAFATGSAGIIGAIQLLPIDGEWKVWITFGALAIQWLASLYFRAITKESV